MKIAFQTLGCKLNYSETSDAAGKFIAAGHEIVSDGEPCDIYVINSCAVTEMAERKCRTAIRQARRKHPDSFLAVVGCFSQIRSAELSAMEEVNLVVGNELKSDLVALIEEAVSGGYPKVYNTDIRRTRTFSGGHSSEGRTRAFLKVQDGCNHGCTYCTIPSARGRSRSATINEVVKQIADLDQDGLKEIVLTGVNVGDFGRPAGESLSDLLKTIAQLQITARIRIGSVEPELLSDAIIACVADSHLLMPHFHLPFQAASDLVLKRMKRKYTTAMLTDRVNAILHSIPDAFIACDLITGFPGETEHDFLLGYAFMEQIPVSTMHVFSYSDRPGTPSYDMLPKVPQSVIKERSRRLHALAEEKKHSYFNRFLGDIRTVLLESGRKSGWMSGFTDNYIRVGVPFRKEWVNQRVSVKITKMGSNGMMIGEVINPLETVE